MNIFLEPRRTLLNEPQGRSLHKISMIVWWVLWSRLYKMWLLRAQLLHLIRISPDGMLHSEYIMSDEGRHSSMTDVCSYKGVGWDTTTI
jgi:hypothetical protein